MAYRVKNRFLRWFAVGVVIFAFAFVLTLIPQTLAISFSNQVVLGLFLLFSIFVLGFVAVEIAPKMVAFKTR